MLNIGARRTADGKAQIAIFKSDQPVFGSTNTNVKRALATMISAFGLPALNDLPIRPSMKPADDALTLEQALNLTLAVTLYTREQLLQDAERDYGEAGIFAVESADIPQSAYARGYDYIVDTHLAPHLEEELIARDQLN